MVKKRIIPKNKDKNLEEDDDDVVFLYESSPSPSISQTPTIAERSVPVANPTIAVRSVPVINSTIAERSLPVENSSISESYISLYPHIKDLYNEVEPSIATRSNIDYNEFEVASRSIISDYTLKRKLIVNTSIDEIEFGIRSKITTKSQPSNKNFVFDNTKNPYFPLYGEVVMIFEILSYFQDLRNILTVKNFIDLNSIYEVINFCNRKYYVYFNNNNIPNQSYLKKLCSLLIGESYSYYNNNVNYLSNILALRCIFVDYQNDIIKKILNSFDNILTYLLKNEILTQKITTRRNTNFTFSVGYPENVFEYSEDVDYIKNNQGQIYTFYFNDNFKDDVNIVPVRIEAVPKFNVPTITQEVLNKIIDVIKLNSDNINSCLLTDIIDDNANPLKPNIINTGKIKYSTNKAYTLYGSFQSNTESDMYISSIFPRNENQVFIPCETSRFIYYFILLQLFDHIHDIKRFPQNNIIKNEHILQIKIFITKIILTNPTPDEFLNQLILELYNENIPINNPNWATLSIELIKDKEINNNFISQIENRVLELVLNYINTDEKNNKMSMEDLTNEKLDNLRKNVIVDNAIMAQKFRNLSTIMMLLDGGAFKRSSYFSGNVLEMVLHHSDVSYFLQMTTEIRKEKINDNEVEVPWICITNIFLEDKMYHFTKHYCCILEPIHNQQVWTGINELIQNNQVEWNNIKSNPALFVIRTGLKELCDGLQFPCISNIASKQIYAFSNPNFDISTIQPTPNFNPAFPFQDPPQSLNILKNETSDISNKNIIFTTPDRVNGASVIFMIKNFPQIIIPNINYIIQILTSSLRLRLNVVRDGENSVKIIKKDKLIFDREIRRRINNIMFNSFLDILKVQLTPEEENIFNNIDDIGDIPSEELNNLLVNINDRAAVENRTILPSIIQDLSKISDKNYLINSFPTETESSQSSQSSQSSKILEDNITKNTFTLIGNMITSQIVTIGEVDYILIDGGAGAVSVLQRPTFKQPLLDKKIKNIITEKVKKPSIPETNIMKMNLVENKQLFNYENLSIQIDIIRNNSYTLNVLINTLEKIKNAIIQKEINELSIQYLMYLYNNVVSNYSKHTLNELNSENFIKKIDEILLLLNNLSNKVNEKENEIIDEENTSIYEDTSMSEGGYKNKKYINKKYINKKSKNKKSKKSKKNNKSKKSKSKLHYKKTLKIKNNEKTNKKTHKKKYVKKKKYTRRKI